MEMHRWKVFSQAHLDTTAWARSLAMWKCMGYRPCTAHCRANTSSTSSASNNGFVFFMGHLEITQELPSQWPPTSPYHDARLAHLGELHTHHLRAGGRTDKHMSSERVLVGAHGAGVTLEHDAPAEQAHLTSHAALAPLPCHTSHTCHTCHAHTKIEHLLPPVSSALRTATAMVGGASDMRHGRATCKSGACVGLQPRGWCARLPRVQDCVVAWGTRYTETPSPYPTRYARHTLPSSDASGSKKKATNTGKQRAHAHRGGY